MRDKKRYYRCLCMLLCGALLLGTVACGPVSGGKEEVSQSVAQTVSSEDLSAGTEDNETIESYVQESAGQGENQKAERIHITDFYEYVNGDWSSKREVSQEKPRQMYMDDIREGMEDTVKDLLENLDISTLSPEDGMYKLIIFYRQLQDTDLCNRLGDQSLKDYLAKMEKVKTLDQLYELYKDKKLGIQNGITSHTIIRADYGGNEMFVSPIMNLSFLNEENREQTIGELMAVLKVLGYSEKRAREMAENACDIDKIIGEFQEETADISLYYPMEQKKLDEAGIEFPILEIFGAQGLLSETNRFYAYLEYQNLLKRLYVKENVPKLRDHMMVSVISYLGMFGSEDLRAALVSLMWGADYFAVKDEYAYYMVRSLGRDVLGDYYRRNLLEEEQIQAVRDMTDEVSKSMRDVISDAKWLTVHGRELAKRKVNHLKVYVGEHDKEALFEDVELTEDPVENALRLGNSRHDYKKVMFEDIWEPYMTQYDMLEVNGMYDPNYNAMIILSGWLSGEYASKDAAYEERLAYLGFLVAHEISHAYDPWGSQYTEEGIREPWMKEEEYESYQKKVDQISAFFDGKETKQGTKINGEQIKQEAFADLMAMDCMLRMLEKKEDADYDLFFRTCAKYRASKMTAEYEADFYSRETHLPEEMRVNYILGQFDKFYEIYDVDESSPYFVPSDQRITAF